MGFWSWGKSKTVKQPETLKQPVPEQATGESLEQLVILAKDGDTGVRDRIIRMYKPFCMRVTSQFFRRFVDPAVDDGFSIALLAFNEAIDAFRLEAGRSFLKFSETVIRRRLTDWVRKEIRFKDQIPWSAWEEDPDDPDGRSAHPAEAAASAAAHAEQEDAQRRRDEISTFEETLRKYGFGFAELAAAAPKHADTRESLWRISAVMCDDRNIREKWVASTRVPLQELAVRCGVSVKMLEKHRKTLIAYALLAMGDFPYLHGYMKRTSEERGGDA